MMTSFATTELIPAVSEFDDLVVQIGEQLRSRGWNISCAESCTGGGVAFWLTSVAGSSDWFKQSFVTYSNEAKQCLLGVAQKTLEEYGAVSQETVIEMANGCARNTDAQVSVAVSGIAGPGGGSADKPVGTVWFAFGFPSGITTHCMQFDGDRTQVRLSAIGFVLKNLALGLVAE